MATFDEDTELLQIQAEVELIKSMYGGEVEDLRPVDKLSKEELRFLTTSVRLRLTPLKGYSEKLPDHHTMCIIKLSTDNDYPSSCAQMEIEDYKGLTRDEMNELKDLLLKELTLAGERKSVVFYDICRVAKDYLAEHARPDRGSVYDEMMARQMEEQQKQKELQELERKKTEEAKKIKSKLLEETNAHYINERKAERREAAHNRDSGVLHRSLSTTRDEVSPGHSSPSKSGRNRSSNSSSDFRCIDLVGLGKREKTVEILQKLEVKERHSTYKVADRTSKAEGVLHCWVVYLLSKIEPDANIRYDELMNKLNAIEREIKSLMKLNSEEVIIYEAYKIDKQANYVEVYFLQPYVESSNLCHYRKKGIHISESMLRYFARGILLSLNYLHQNNVVHRDLRESSIFLNAGESDVLRIADYGVERKLLETIGDYQNIEVPSSYSTPNGLSIQKRDVYRVGLILLSLFAGKQVTNASKPKIMSTLSSKFKYFINCCLNTDSSKWSAKELLQHPFFSEELTRSISPLNAEATDAPKQFAAKQKQACNVAWKDHLETICNDKSEGEGLGHEGSRITQDYDILEVVGKGGFGKVYKVRNNIDRRIYAVKTIKLANESTASAVRIKREAETLSPINHENIVRYYTSWVDVFSEDESEDEDSDCESISVNTKSDALAIVLQKRDEISFDEDGDDDGIDFTSDYMKRNDESEYVFFESPGAANEKEESKSTSQDTDQSHRQMFESKKATTHLFIKMEYCENKTLRQAIDDGLHTNNVRLWRFFREIVQGLDYIHSLNIIHRDLKPGNIFIDVHDRIKIGDFGLATMGKNYQLIEAENSEGMQVVSSNGQEASTCLAGTFLYQAPELLIPCAKSTCISTKLDLYSLGIIFFEMTCLLPSSGHERIDLIQRARRASIELPEYFKEIRYSKKREILNYLLVHDPEKRMSAADLLRSDAIPPLSTEEQKFRENLEKKLENKNSEIYRHTLDILFQPTESEKQEVKFMHNVRGTKLQAEHLDFVADQTQSICKEYGGIWISAPSLVPKGCFYNEQETFNVLSESGSPLSFCPDLRYPFARLATIREMTNVRRYFVQRVQYRDQINPDFPVERHECAFDIISQPSNRLESCARVVKLGQDVLKFFSTFNSDLVHCVSIDVSYVPLAKAVLRLCRVPDACHIKALSFIKREIRNESDPEDIFNKLIKELNLKNVSRAIKKFIAFNDCPSKFGPLLSKKSFDFTLVNEAKQKFTDLKLIVSSMNVMGLEFSLNFRPLFVFSLERYSAFSCRFMLFAGKVHKKKRVTLMVGEMYDDLVNRYREMVPSSAIKKLPISASGISISLERLTAAVFSDSDAPVPPLKSVQGMGCGGNKLVVLAAYVGKGKSPEETKLMDRVLLINALRSNGVAADFTCLRTDEELFDVSVPILVTYLDGSERVSIKHCRNERGYWAAEKRVAESVLLDTIMTLVAAESLDAKHSSCGNGPQSSLPAAKEEKMDIEMFPRKSNKAKEFAKSDDQARREKEVTGLFSRWGVAMRGYKVLVCCLDLDRDCIGLMGTVDLDSVGKSFSDCLLSLKGRIDSRDWEYVERFLKTVQQRISSRKPTDKPFVVLAYSLQSDYYKRLF